MIDADLLIAMILKITFYHNNHKNHSSEQITVQT